VFHLRLSFAVTYALLGRIQNDLVLGCITKNVTQNRKNMVVIVRRLFLEQRKESADIGFSIPVSVAHPPSKLGTHRYLRYNFLECGNFCVIQPILGIAKQSLVSVRDLQGRLIAVKSRYNPLALVTKMGVHVLKCMVLMKSFSNPPKRSYSQLSVVKIRED